MMRNTGRARATRRKAFTLIELLVVITIISLLMALLVVLIQGVVERARNGKTYSMIKMLDMACQTYHKDFFVYPPQPPTNSSSLHLHLGSNRVLQISHRRSTGNNAPAPTQTKPPIVQFTADQLNLQGGRTDTSPNPPVEVVDAYGQVLMYTNPGIVNVKMVDIASPGKDGVFETNPNVTETDDVNNWIKDF